MEPIEFRDIDLILSLSEELNFTRAAEKNCSEGGKKFGRADF